jgi:bleomycin hydrolase
MDRALSAGDVGRYRKDFAENPAYRLTQNAVTRVNIDDVAIDREIINNTDHSFSTFLDDWKATNQERSGRCWLFAGLNLLRPGAMKKMNLKDFEFSQNFVSFWHKFERANYFLEAIIETADRDTDDRTVAYLLESPADDGGQWNMFAAIVSKYGLVPKAFMPETAGSSNTSKMNSTLHYLLRQAAKSLREVAATEGTESARAVKGEILQGIYRVLCIHLGTPPERFDWQWMDKDREFHRDGMITPREFAEKYVDLPIDDYVCLVHDPRPSSPTGRTFTIEYLGNVLGAPPVTYLNVDMSVIKEIAARTLQQGEPVWFGCDVTQMLSTEYGIWDANLYDLSSLYDLPFVLAKPDRLAYHETSMTHAMLFTGVDMLDGAPRKWRVENSWGTEKGKDGFYTMNDSWFDEYVFEIAARRTKLPAELQRALDTAPIVLPAWDPMGSLASGNGRRLR